MPKTRDGTSRRVVNDARACARDEALEFLRPLLPSRGDFPKGLAMDMFTLLGMMASLLPSIVPRMCSPSCAPCEKE